MESFDHLAQEDNLKAENEFLKMKLMLEHGARFGSNGNNELPPELENEFLNNIAAFEQQYADQKMIKVFDKIARPAHFRPVIEIPDSDIDKAWSELRNYLNEYSIDLDVCSSNISTRELYRFTTEELFEHETDDMDLPGWTTNFIYDEFHPDPVYDNTRTAMDDCIRSILQQDPLEWTHDFRDKNLRLNDLYPLTIEELKTIVNRFKAAYDNLDVIEIAAIDCMVNAKDSYVTGSYLATAGISDETLELAGHWKVVFELDEVSGYSFINTISIEGIKF